MLLAPRTCRRVDGLALQRFRLRVPVQLIEHAGGFGERLDRDRVPSAQRPPERVERLAEEVPRPLEISAVVVVVPQRGQAGAHVRMTRPQRGAADLKARRSSSPARSMS
jgi:hypothetical protein